jgi:peptidoglycan/LPS O-acetylase OafA/YrhL
MVFFSARFPHSSVALTKPTNKQRLVFLDALRALASIAIVLHHFALYAPLRDLAAPLIGPLLDWLMHNARATQVFFVVGGYVMARSMADKIWNLRQLRLFLLQRYCRLSIPYLVTMAFVLVTYVFARGWLPEEVTGGQVTLRQLFAHLFFIQGIVGEENLSAGFWFICINFQLGLLYATLLCLRDTAIHRNCDISKIIGWGLAAFSLFYFNLDGSLENWALYFFPYFYMGIIINRAVQRKGAAKEFWLYLALIVAALSFEWRWRLAMAVVVGVIVYAAGRTGWGSRWPNSPLIARLGKISYSLFLVHFPVLVLVATAYVRQGWTSPEAAVAGLITAFFLSIGTAVAFHRWVETPSIRFARSLTAPQQPGGTFCPQAA